MAQTKPLHLCYGTSGCVLQRTLKTHTFLNTQHMWWIFIAAALTSPWQPMMRAGPVKNRCFLSGNPQHELSRQTHVFSHPSRSLFLWGVWFNSVFWFSFCCYCCFLGFTWLHKELRLEHNYPAHSWETRWVTLLSSRRRFKMRLTRAVWAVVTLMLDVAESNHLKRGFKGVKTFFKIYFALPYQTFYALHSHFAIERFGLQHLNWTTFASSLN